MRVVAHQNQRKAGGGNEGDTNDRFLAMSGTPLHLMQEQRAQQRGSHRAGLQPPVFDEGEVELGGERRFGCRDLCGDGGFGGGAGTLGRCRWRLCLLPAGDERKGKQEEERCSAATEDFQHGWT